MSFRRLKNHAIESGAIAPEDILLSQLLVALSLSQTRRHMALSHFEPASCTKTGGDLQNITIRLFAAYGVTYNGTFALMDESDGVSPGDELDEDIWLAGPKKKKNVPGMNTMLFGHLEHSAQV